MALSTQANTGILNFLNGVIPKVFSSPHLNHPTVSDMTNTTNGSASFSMLMTCSLLEATTLLKNTFKIRSKIATTLNSSALHNGSYRCVFTSIMTPAIPWTNTIMSLTHFNIIIPLQNFQNATHPSHLTIPSVQKTAPSLTKTLHLLTRSNSAFPFALLSALSSTLPTTPKLISSLPSVNLPKPALHPVFKIFAP